MISNLYFLFLFVDFLCFILFTSLCFNRMLIIHHIILVFICTLLRLILNAILFQIWLSIHSFTKTLIILLGAKFENTNFAVENASFDCRFRWRSSGCVCLATSFFFILDQLNNILVVNFSLLCFRELFWSRNLVWCWYNY